MTAETSNKLAEILITKYMRLTEDDLEEWDNNPEEWALEEEADSWRYQLRVRSDSTIRRNNVSLWGECANRKLHCFLDYSRALKRSLWIFFRATGPS